MTRELSVAVGDRSYTVHVGAGLASSMAERIPHLASAERVAVIADAAEALTPTVDQVGGSLSSAVSEVHILRSPSGESAKSMTTAEHVWRFLAAAGCHRNDVLVAVGGGATCDLAGFVASTFHRGMPWVAVPTTLLAMVDAAIGGKTAIDLPEGKNLVGAFHQPRAVVADIDALGTLPAREFSTGMAEVIKHALLTGGPLLEMLTRARDAIEDRHLPTLETLIADAAAVKTAVVAEDETEQGRRAHLNYGHTLAHAVETLDGYAGRTHGEAVAIGMMFAAHLSAGIVGYADRVSEHRALLELYGLPTAGATHPLEAVESVWTRDKKYDRGMRFVVLEDIGAPTIVRDVPDDIVRAAYEVVR